MSGAVQPPAYKVIPGTRWVPARTHIQLPPLANNLEVSTGFDQTSGKSVLPVGCRFLVDGFRFASPTWDAYFLSHAHSGAGAVYGQHLFVFHTYQNISRAGTLQ